MPRNRARRIIADAALAGRATSEGELCLAPWCGEPVLIWIRGLPDPVLEPLMKPVLRVAQVACRRCKGCLQHRANLWAARAFDEAAQASRNWFGTLTVRPELQHSALTRARAAAKAQGHMDFDELEASERFRRHVAELRPFVQKFFKRLRKGGAVFRYLAVVEEHTCKCALCGRARERGAIVQKTSLPGHTGFPHFHVLLHEIGLPIRKARLDHEWSHGFCQWRLVDGEQGLKRAVFYAAKYATKTNAGRLASSLKYGAARIGSNISVNNGRAVGTIEETRLSED